MTTPIDPTNVSALRNLYYEQWERENKYIDDCLNSAEGAIAEDEIDGMIDDRSMNSIRAVASAIVPEGYAVVSVADVRNLVDGMFQYMGPHEDWDFLRYALPASDDADKENAK